MKIFLCLTLALLMMPGALQSVFSQDIQGVTEQQRLLDRFNDSKLPKSGFDDDTSAVGVSIDRADAEQHRFTFKSIKFPGMTLYDTYDMQPLYEEMLGTEISLADILDLAKQIEEKYATDGYSTARVVLQRLPDSGGRVALLVIEEF